MFESEVFLGIAVMSFGVKLTIACWVMFILSVVVYWGGWDWYNTDNRPLNGSGDTE
jgi:hypothetical protein